MSRYLLLTVLVFIAGTILLKMVCGEVKDYTFCIFLFLFFLFWIYTVLITIERINNIGIKNGRLWAYQNKTCMLNTILDKTGDEKIQEIPLVELKDAWFYKTRDTIDKWYIDKRYYTIYTLVVVGEHDTIEYSLIGKNKYSVIFDVFRKIYPFVAVTLKRHMVRLILGANSDAKKYLGISRALHDDGFRIQLLNIPYGHERAAKIIDLKWDQVNAELTDNGKECIITSPADKGLHYQIHAEKPNGRANRFDQYVIWDIINDIHREGVNKMSELSYMKEFKEVSHE